MKLPLPENSDERRMFDQSLDLFKGDKIACIAATLAIWAGQELNRHPGGSFGEQLAIMANELHAYASESGRDMKSKTEKMLVEILQNQFAILSALANMSEVPGNNRRACRHRAYVTEGWMADHDIQLQQL
jgi:hypothetical protein